MTIGSNVLAILNILRGWGNLPSLIDTGVAEISHKLDCIKIELGTPEAGNFNPPSNLVKTVKVEQFMSVLQLEVGQTAVGTATFSEPQPPADGTVTSDTPAVATISLGADLATWTCVGVSVGTATMNWAGTSAPPDVGPVQVAPMIVTVVAVPTAETGDFNPTGAVITGP